jgi:broad specificity phosphatase PhoE
MNNYQQRVWLVRHGETEWSRSGQHTGRTDIPLTETGRERARAAGRSLAGKKFALVLSSPRTRAQETCRLAGYGDALIVDDNLQEWDYGAYEGRTSADIQREVPGWSIWKGPIPRGETIEQVAARADRVIERALGADGDVGLFAHGHILRVLTARWLQEPPDTGRLLALDTGSISVLGYEHDTRVIRQWNLVPQ